MEHDINKASANLDRRIREDCEKRLSEPMARAKTAAMAAYARELAPFFGATTNAMVSGAGIDVSELGRVAFEKLVERETDRIVSALLGKQPAPLALEQDAPR